MPFSFPCKGRMTCIFVEHHVVGFSARFNRSPNLNRSHDLPILILSAYPMHKTNEHSNSNSQRYSIACHTPAGVGDCENRENQNVRED